MKRGVHMIDVYLFSGFLGSGKTSLLLHTIAQLKEQGKKPAVLMNEFGALPFDSNAVEGEGEVPLKELLDGCICCTGSEKTEAQLQGLLEENDDIDVILIETTGAAHPVEALDAIYSPLFADRLNIKGIVTVADSKRWLERDKLSPQIRALFMEQIRHAHLLIANKVDLLTEEEVATVTFELSSFNEFCSNYTNDWAQKLRSPSLRKPLVHRKKGLISKSYQEKASAFFKTYYIY